MTEAAGLVRTRWRTPLVVLLAAAACNRSGAAEFVVSKSAAPSVVELGGHSAQMSGPEAQVESGMIGHWHSVDTQAKWDLSLASPCVVGVEVIAAVDRQFAGSEFVLQLGDEELRGKLEATGGWFDFQSVSLGEVALPQGDVRVTLRPVALPQGVFGNVRAVRLSGVKLQETAPTPPTDLAGPIRVYTTARYDGTRISQRNSLSFGATGPTDAPLIVLDPATRYQRIEGFGGAFTEASAYVYSRLSPAKRQEFLRACFDRELGHGYRLGRTHINSCDFCLGSYAYDETPGDLELKDFSIEHDRRLLLPFLKAAQEVAGDEPIKLLASPWSPPAWMKTNGKMIEGGKLKPECRDAWARYYCRYIQEYRREGVDVWAITVQNEPMAVQRWESCIYAHEEERDFVRDHLGPALREHGCDETKLLVWDHNRDLLFHRAKTVFDDPRAAQYVWGAGFHWYVTDDFENVELVHEFYPDKQLLFTEGCVEHGAHLGDWTAGERYARSVINDLNHWAVGWIDWNLLLDIEGGPNHVRNYCSAPIIGDLANDELIYNCSYYYLGHFARFIRPGATRIRCRSTGDELLATAFLNEDGALAVVILNVQDRPVPCTLALDDARATANCPPRSISTLLLDLGDVPR